MSGLVLLGEEFTRFVKLKTLFATLAGSQVGLHGCAVGVLCLPLVIFSCDWQQSAVR